MLDDLKIQIQSGERHGRRIVRLVGRLNIETVPEFLKVMRGDQSPVVILDFSGVAYIDSAAVGALIQTHVALQKSGQMLALAGVSPRVDAVLDITHVKRIFRTFPNVAAAEEVLG
jgi:anti-sigma B factor antagonist